MWGLRHTPCSPIIQSSQFNTTTEEPHVKKTTTPAQIERRNMEEAGRLSYAACQVFAPDTKIVLQRQVETLLAPVVEPVLEQFRDGLISPTELLHKLGEVHYTVQAFTDLAAKEDVVYKEEAMGTPVTVPEHYTRFDKVGEAMGYLEDEGIARVFNTGDGHCINCFKDGPEPVAVIYEHSDHIEVSYT